MSAALRILRIGPGASLQDEGRPGVIGEGISRGGAADRLALAEGAALLGHAPTAAALEMPGMGGVFEAEGALTVALTGAPMRAQVEGRRLAWNAAHRIEAGQRLEIGAAEAGVFGYLHLPGGIAGEAVLGSRAAHLAAGLGRPAAAGDRLVALAGDGAARAGLCLPIEPRVAGGTIRLVEGPQTALFDPAERARFCETAFTRDPRSNRQGMRLVSDGAGFRAAGQLDILSEFAVPGDIQVIGDGTPVLLGPECQTTGGYPRLGTVVPQDMPRAMQAGAGAVLRFAFLPHAEALADYRRQVAARAALPSRVVPLARAPEDAADLLAHQLISGVTAGHDENH